MEMLDQIKKSQRITHDLLDDILRTDIDAGADELMRAGVEPFDGEGNISERPLVRKAIELYAKGMEDFEEKGSVYMASFEKLRDAMALSGDYNVQRTDNISDDSQDA
ncbi:MAG: hypothetical protein K1W30_13850 [Lachnospiraceae bacterium]